MEIETLHSGPGPNGTSQQERQCAPLWHERMRRQFDAVRLTLLVGQYAQSSTYRPQASRSPMRCASRVRPRRACSRCRTRAGAGDLVLGVKTKDRAAD